MIMKPSLDKEWVWPEAQILREPARENLSEPIVLVRRRESGLVGPGGQELAFFESYPHISLFSGCGGMDIGLERAGWTTVVQHEWSHTACLTLMANRPKYFRHSALIQGDILKTPTSMLLEEGGLRVGEAYIITGGPPCQGFSTANMCAAKGLKDKRNDLIFAFLQKVDEAKPRFFIFENVPGFIRFNKGEYFEAFLRRAFDCYYDLVYGLIDCADYMVPQRRIRFLCMGTRRDLSEIEGNMAGLPAPICFGGRDLKIVRAGGDEAAKRQRPPGIRCFPDRPILVPPSPQPIGESDGRPKHYLDFYDRLERDEPDRIVRVANA